ncbi:MAG: hypothetical protein C4543_02940, partial [Ignavibacteriales bacterium]
AFNANDGSAVTSITQDYMTAVTQPTDPTKEGYTFGGWYSDEGLTTAFSFTTMPAEDIMLYAKWDLAQFTISFESNGGSLIDSITQDYLSTVTSSENPTKQGYTFDGWFSDNTLTTSYNFTTMPSEDITVYAKWNPNLYEVTFVLNNGETNVIETDYAGSELMTPNYVGYTFDGWYLDSGLLNIYPSVYFPTSSITLYAKWSIATYTISYELFDGVNNATNPKTYTILTDNFIYQAPSKEGYTFVGWYNNDSFEGNSVTFQLQGTTGDITLYAKWNINQYNINYYVYDEFEYNVGFALTVNELISSISTGGYHSAALTSEGRLFTWGYNGYGELGSDSLVSTNSPMDITSQFNLSNGEKIISFSLGAYHSAALTSNGRIFMWGMNSSGQLGDGTSIDKHEPIDITGKFTLNIGERIDEIILGAEYSAAITSMNRVFTWGNNSSGQLGNGTKETKNIPIEITAQFNLNISEKIDSISLGTAHSSAITSSGRIFMWGSNWSGMLGDGSGEDKTVPVDITSKFNLLVDEKIISSSLGNAHSIVLTSNNRIFTWGSNSLGQLGDGTTITRTVPVEITNKFVLSTNEIIVSIDTFEAHSSALSSNGQIFMWGYNYDGQLGDGTTVKRTTPTNITNRFTFENEEKITVISLGRDYSSALTTKGNVFTWGANNIGQLGDSTSTSKYTPVKIGSFSPILMHQESYDFGSPVNAYNPSKDGYHFIGWYQNDFNNQYSFANMPANDVNLIGYWQIINYSIEYIVDGGINNIQNPISYTVEDGEILLIEPTKFAYTFLGWYVNPEFSGDALTSISQGSFTNFVLYAKWQINEYTIAFDSNFGTSIEPIIQNYATPVTTPSNPVRQGYTFAGWYSDSSLTSSFTFDLMPAANIILYAKWNPNVYITTYVLNNGEDNIVEVDYAGSDLLLPVYAGYEFAGWYTDEALTIPYDSTTFPTSNQTLYAKWYEIYSITYNLDGGINDISNPSTYTNAVLAIELSEPVREGYTFIGWYYNSEYTGDRVLAIPHDSIGDISLFAKWEINQYTVSYFQYDYFDLTSGIPLYVGESIKKLDLGDMHSIALTTSGRVFTWGINSYGQLGDGTIIPKYFPTEITNNFNLFPTETIVNVYAGSYNTLAITSSGRVFIWGIDFNGFFDGLVMTYNENSLPIDITNMFQFSDDDQIIDISSSGMKILALSAKGRVFMWGEEYEGIMLDDRIIYNSTTWAIDITNDFTLEENDKIVEISVGYSFATALSSQGQMFVWGHNESGQLGNDSTQDVYLPLNITNQFQLNAEEHIIDISTGGGHAAVITSSGRLFTWGSNYNGQLGNGTLTNHLIPIDITANFNLSNDEKIVFVDLGRDNSSVITTIGRIFTWGNNSQGKLGDGTNTNRLYPVEITTNFVINLDEAIISLSLGGEHSSVLTSLGIPFIWGYNGYGTLGDGTTISSFTPKETPFISAKNIHSDIFNYSDSIVAYDSNIEGYTFLGWYIDAERTVLYNFQTMPSNDIILYGKWEINNYTVTFMDVDGTVYRTDLLQYGEQIDLSFNPVVQYQFFKEWCIDEELLIPLDDANMPPHDLVLYAKWREINAPEVFTTEIGSTYILFSLTWDNPDDLQTVMLIPTIFNADYMAVSNDWVGFYDLQPNTEYTIYIDAGIGLYDTPMNDIVYVGYSISVTTLP